MRMLQHIWLPPHLPARVPALCSVGETDFLDTWYSESYFLIPLKNSIQFEQITWDTWEMKVKTKIKYFTNDPSFVCPLENFDLDFPVIPTTFLPYFICYKNKSTYHNFTDVCVFWTLVNWIEPFSLLKFNRTKAFACRYKHFWANDHKTITYDRSKSLKEKYIR